jgi:hypothetical protein
VSFAKRKATLDLALVHIGLPPSPASETHGIPPQPLEMFDDWETFQLD